MRTALAWMLAGVALMCGFFADAASAAVDKGVLSMTPARRTFTGHPPVKLTPTRISNSTKLPMDVTAFPVLLTQELDGSFGFRQDPRDLNAAKVMFPVGPQKFVMQPGDEKFLNLRWQLLPRQAKAGYFGLIVQGVPKAKGKGVGSVLRLLGINFFTLPGRWHVDGKLTGLRGEQAAPQVLRFFPKVRNTGQIHEEPKNGHCKIVEPDGTVRVKTLKYGAGVVLPGYEREYPIVVQKPNVLPAGSYVLRCSQRFGKRLSTKDMQFKLSGPNTLPTAQLKLKSISASGEIDGPAKIGAVVQNVGSKTSPAVVKIRVDRIPVGSKPVTVARGSYPQDPIAGGDTKNVSKELGKLVAGNYRVTVVLSDGKSDIDEKTADFTPTKSKGFFEKLKDKWPWLLLLLAVAIVIWLLWRQRRKQHELEEELERARMASAGGVPPATAAGPAAVAATPTPAAAPAPPPRRPAPEAAPDRPPPSGAGAININTAAVEELMQLPGVGRRAAERIVAHREANGPFASLEDLKAVEGWHAERIERIKGTASV